MTRGSVFICYAGEDRSFMNWITDYVKGEIGKNAVWVDHELEAGKEWEPIILQQLASAAVAICLISESFIEAGSYANNTEMPILKFLMVTKNLIIIPVILEEVDCEKYEIPSRIQWANTKGKPLLKEIYEDNLDDFRIELKEIAEKVAKAVRGKWAGSPGPNDLDPDLKARIKAILPDLTDEDVELILVCLWRDDRPCMVRSGSLALIIDLLDNKEALGETFDISLSLAILFELLRRLNSSILQEERDELLYQRKELLDADIGMCRRAVARAIRAFARMNRSCGVSSYNHFKSSINDTNEITTSECLDKIEDTEFQEALEKRVKQVFIHRIDSYDDLSDNLYTILLHPPKGESSDWLQFKDFTDKDRQKYKDAVGALVEEGVTLLGQFKQLGKKRVAVPRGIIQKQLHDAQSDSLPEKLVASSRNLRKSKLPRFYRNGTGG